MGSLDRAKPVKRGAHPMDKGRSDLPGAALDTMASNEGAPTSFQFHL